MDTTIQTKYRKEIVYLMEYDCKIKKPKRKSSIQKMIVDEAPANRQIKSFQNAQFDVTPYNNSDFSEKTKELCSNGTTTSINSLRMSKLIILGDLAVGKTSLVNRFCRNFYDTNYKTTIGVDFEVERFDILKIPFNLQIWDTAGQERFKSIAQSYYRGAHAVVIVFDLTNTLSLMNTRTWLNEALHACGSSSPYIFLVGSKRDLLSKYALKNMTENGSKVAKKLNAELWIVSSKTGDSINEMFCRIATLTFNEAISKSLEDTKQKEIGSDIVSYKNSFKKNNRAESSKCGNRCQ